MIAYATSNAGPYFENKFELKIISETSTVESWESRERLTHIECMPSAGIDN